MPAFDLGFDAAGSDDAQGIRAAVERGIAAAERVHRLPELARPIPIRIDQALPVTGRYLAPPGGEEVVLHPEAEVPTITFLHELGHMLDHLGTGGHTQAVMTDELDGVVRDWWQADRGAWMVTKKGTLTSTPSLCELRERLNAGEAAAAIAKDLIEVYGMFHEDAWFQVGMAAGVLGDVDYGDNPPEDIRWMQEELDRLLAEC